MRRLLFLSVLLSTLVFFGNAQNLYFKNGPVVVNVDEGLEIESKLGLVECALNTTGVNPFTTEVPFKYKITLVKVNENDLCGGDGQCFSIRSQDDSAAQPLYFIYHYPFNTQRLMYAVRNTYTLDITCEDNLSNTLKGQAEVRVIPNMPPVFVTKSGESVTFSAADLTAGTLVFTVSANDPENNPLEYSLTDGSGKFAIDEQTGQIRVLEGFEGLCNGTSKFTFQVTVKDPYHMNLIPINIDLNIDYPNQPSLIGANQEITVSETDPVGMYFHSFNVFDGTLAIDVENPITPASIASKFVLQSDVMRITEQFNFEEASSGNISLVVTNGVCKKLYFLVIKVKDENDPPTLFPKIQTGIVEEGLIQYDMQSFVDDEDVSDSHTYRILKATEGTVVITDKFTIDNNGLITSRGDFDLDSLNLNSRTVVFDVEVMDPGGLTDTGQVTLIINNANDNNPIISTTTIYNDQIMDCSGPMQIGSIAATDADFGTNGDIIYTATSSGPLSVTADGSIFVTSAIAAGSTHQLTVNAEDLGNPPRESSVPVTITVVGQPCTTTTTTLAPTVNINVSISTNNSNNNNNNNNNNNQNTVVASVTTPATVATPTLLDNSLNLIWIVLLAVLGLLLLLLLLYLLWKFCFPLCCPGVCGVGEAQAGGPCGTDSFCGRCCSCCRQEPPRAPRVRGEGDIHDFWQEHYQEQDYQTTYHRGEVPKPAPHELGYLRYN
ncbi:hypothetical protein LOTGIDRAFT_237871 [Lottia gigantea]|uniref:Cadherin domain-containing protein n=1 Tax=Lottia gigantea TaxID=225164 RepID=V4AF13_LOTGI|nr:hypothetical protein LOTGIDRAFT_237871 [Lottia gigantea]ESP02629.1 hypothetical protein LOTGIDRAFT_237871 [Lottia gigantea]